MFVQVKLLNGFQEPLWYHAPTLFHDATGTLVRVPIRKREATAIITQCSSIKPSSLSFTIRDIIGIETFPHDYNYYPFIVRLAEYYQIEPLFFLKRIRQFLIQKEQSIDTTIFEHHASTGIILTHEQQIISNFVKPHIRTPAYTPTVIHGVTGSGKTEIYKDLITCSIAEQKTILFMVPEVTLAIAFTQRLKQELPSHISIASFHSATSNKEKKQLWQRLLHANPTLIIGVHLPILLPIPNLGLIIIDEEHDNGYQEKKHPKINTKEAALMRAQTAHIPIVLGSATPCITTLHQVHTKKWHFFQLTERFAGTLPQIQTVFLSDKKERKNFWISQPLYQALKTCLAKQEQAIIFLNRRGFSFFVQCKACNFIITCIACSVSLTLHEDNILSCHYCDFNQPLPTHCIACKKNDFLKKGIGTQQVVTILQSLFPNARVARADLDTTKKKKKWDQTVYDMINRHIDILVGTQTITKGYHFPYVTVVGILWADINLNFPVYNAAEITLQQLIQVAGRAGRQIANSTVIVQHMTEHSSFNYLDEKKYLNFYQEEIITRASIGYPPCKRLVELEIKHTDMVIVEQEAHRIKELLLHAQHTLALNVHILGPAKPPVHTINHMHHRKLYLKASSFQEIIKLYKTINHQTFESSIFFTPNPIN